MFSETVMLAPDLSSKTLEVDRRGRFIADFSRRVHVYYSKFDRVLKASSTKRFGQDRLGRHGARDYLNLAPNVIAIDAKLHANSDSTAGLRDRRGGQVSVHSSHRYHPGILSDVVEVLSSVDRDQIPARQIVDDPDLPGRSNHYQLIA